jgi:4-azaleucine resistance transporter AzlC
MKAKNEKWNACRAAFPYTFPILTGFIFLGIAYGIYMHSLGFSAIYPILMRFTIFAGSMEFIAANLLLAPFNPVNALF